VKSNKNDLRGFNRTLLKPEKYRKKIIDGIFTAIGANVVI
jgi:hypothetical protein